MRIQLTGPSSKMLCSVSRDLWQDLSKVRDLVLWCAVPSQQVICTPYQLSRDHQELADTVAGHIWAHIRPQQVAIEGSNCWFHWSLESELWVSMSHRCGQHIAHWHRRNCITSPLNLGVEKSLETLCNFLQLTVRLAYFRRFFMIFPYFRSIWKYCPGCGWPGRGDGAGAAAFWLGQGSHASPCHGPFPWREASGPSCCYFGVTSIGILMDFEIFKFSSRMPGSPRIPHDPSIS